MAETISSLTDDQLLAYLDNPHFSSYLYLGEEDSHGWRMALGAQKMIPAFRVYRGRPDEYDRIRKLFATATTPAFVGVTFGYSREPKGFLAKKIAEDFLDLADAILDARK